MVGIEKGPASARHASGGTSPQRRLGLASIYKKLDPSLRCEDGVRSGIMGFLVLYH